MANDIVECEESNTLLIMLVAMLKEYIDTNAVMLLIEVYRRYLMERAGYIKEVIAENVSTGGDKLISRLGFKVVKEYKDGYKLFNYGV